MFKLDTESALLEPDFHDGLLRGVLVDLNSTLTITCTGVNRQQEYVLRVPGTNSLVVNDFRQGNIIFNIYLFEGSRSPREVVAQAMGIRDEEDQTPVDAMEAKVRQNNWVTIHITSSYGCELCGICECSLNAIEIRPLAA
jgi:hypothetical protein